MIGVTLFGLMFTPVFYVVVRRFAQRRGGSTTAEGVAAAHPAE